jgi:exosortase
LICDRALAQTVSEYLEKPGWESDRMNRSFISRKSLFLGIVGASIAVHWRACLEVGSLALSDENSSHILVVPFISAWFLWIQRRELTASPSPLSNLTGGMLLALGVLGYAGGWIMRVSGHGSHLAVWMLSLVCVWSGGFLLAFGAGATRKAAFPLAFLLFMVPLPETLMQFIIWELQRASTALAYGMFQLIGIPVYREGFVLSLPQLTIEVARECSGIRSSLGLLLTTLVAAQIFLKSKTSRLVLVASAVPIAIFKNGLRIVTLSLLSIYVDRGFITGRLHHRGGVVFYLVGMGVVFALMKLLQRFEARHDNSPQCLEVSMAQGGS